MSIVIATPTGNIGSVITQILLNAGEKVTIVNRDPAKVQHFADLGAHVIKGSFLEDQAVIDEALTGAKALYWQAPPTSSPNFNEWIYAAANKAADSVVAHGVQRVVLLSSIGAQVGAGTGIIDFYREVEAIFKSKIQHVVIVRAGAFAENFLRDIGSVAAQGMVFSAVGDFPHRIPVVVTADIGRKLATYLLTDNWHGHIITGAHGAKDYTTQEAWAVISKAVGKEIRVINISLEQVAKAMEEHHIPKFFVDGFVEFQDAIIKGRLKIAEARTPETTTTTTLFEWAQTVFKPALEAASNKN